MAEIAATFGDSITSRRHRKMSGIALVCVGWDFRLLDVIQFMAEIAATWGDSITSRRNRRR